MARGVRRYLKRVLGTLSLRGPAITLRTTHTRGASTGRAPLGHPILSATRTNKVSATVGIWARRRAQRFARHGIHSCYSATLSSIKVIHYTGTRVCVCICVCVCVYIIHRLPSPIRGRKRRKHQKEKERVRPRLRGGVRRAGKSSVLLLTRYSGCIPARTIRTPRTRHCAGLSV